MLLPTDMLAPSTSTHSLLLTLMALLFLSMSLLLLLPVLSTSPPRELSMLLRPQLLLLLLLLPMLLPQLLPMLLLPSLPTPLPPMLAPLPESPPWLLTPMVLLSLLTSRQWLLPVLTTSSTRECMEECMLVLLPWLPMVVSWLTLTELLSQLMSLLLLQPGLNTSPSRVEIEKKSKNQLVCYQKSNLLLCEFCSNCYN